MERTVVAVFDALDDAQAVRDDLVAAGVHEDRVSIHCAGVGDFANAAPFETPSGSDGWSGQRAGFLARLFGLEHDIEDALHLHEAVRRGSCVVTVQAGDDDEAKRAEGVLSKRSPVDLDSRVADWRAGGWAPANAPADDEVPRTERSSRGVARGSAEGAASSPVRTYLTGRPAGQTEGNDSGDTPASRRR